MLMVLIVHADFFSIGAPSVEIISIKPISSFLRIAVESFTLVCVNVYIIISGYFGIKIKKKSVMNLLFMIFFWRVVVLSFFIITSYLNFTSLDLSIYKICLMLIPGYDDWFVAQYILLLFFAPILNTFIEKSSLKQLWLFILIYEGFQLVFNWIYPVYSSFVGGYSVLSFVSLYFIGAGIKQTENKIVKSPFALYLGVVLIAATIVWCLGYFGFSRLYSYILGMFGAYNGLSVLLASILLFLTFKQFSFKAKFINNIAMSSFAVYLFHMHPLVRPYYTKVCKYIYESYETIPYIFIIGGFIIAVFCFSIMVDFLRRWIWKGISSYIKL